ncbi:unnamed protein product [Wuchereria bancrofti]|uniref:Heparin-sulfate lyase N-terminal domain-containing protein n=1 Tax=Wuchereria bancrofti TaxID=6293 RepID=A0A3P7E882_WUCBA|nr:unnamed protein product [Wuchereria bancrofti]
MRIPFDWEVDPYSDANWCFQLQTLRYLMVYLSAHKSTGKTEYLWSMMEWFEDWWGWARERPSSNAWSDMATGIRAEKIYHLATQMKRAKIKLPAWFVEMIMEHVRVIRTKGFVRLNHNHGLFAVHGLRCLAEHLGPGLRATVIGNCDAMIEELIINQFDENYVHKEHSPHYHHLVLRSLIKWKKTGLYDHVQILDEYIRGAKIISGYLYLPDGREVPFGDTDNNKYRLSEVELPVSEDNIFWCESGYAVYKNYDSYLCVTNNYHSLAHKHWDNLSFIYGVAGHDILVDPGG